MLKTEKKAAAFGPIARVLSPEKKNPKEFGYGQAGALPGQNQPDQKNAQLRPEKENPISDRLERAPSRIT
jgi:hypothetical protein